MHHGRYSTHIREGTTMKKMLKRRSGFTLVELLIVIIIIGILAGAMLMLVGSGTDRAEATKVISDLRSLKGAALMYYADNPSTTPTGIANLQKYMDRDITSFFFETASADSSAWFVGQNAPGDSIKALLADQAAKTGLWGSANATTPPEPPLDSADQYVDQTVIWMRAR